MKKQAVMCMALLILVSGCGGLGNAWDTTKRVAARSGPVALVAWVTTPLGPVPLLVAVMATDTAMDTLVENTELRSGELKGEEAYVKEIERLRLALANRPVLEVETPVPTPFIPTWVKWILALLALWHTIKFFSNRYRGEFIQAILNLIKGRIPTAVKALGKASGMAHTRTKEG